MIRRALRYAFEVTPVGWLVVAGALWAWGIKGASAVIERGAAPGMCVSRCSCSVKVEGR